MKELSLNILDISENSTKAGATLVEISLAEVNHILTLMIRDNGCGMTPEILRRVTDPFCTTRTTRKVGLGIPLLKLAAEQTGGAVTIESRHQSEFPEAHGTTVTAVFHTDHIDSPPLGDIVSTIVTIIQGHPDTDFLFTHSSDGTGGRPAYDVRLDTREMREVLGGDIPLSSPEVLEWVASSLAEQYGSDENGSLFL